MPLSAVQTIRDEILWQYAKLVSKAAGHNSDHRFTMSKFKDLQSGRIKWATSIREWLKEHESPRECVYCGTDCDLRTDHILPKRRGGPDIADNAIRACRSCNLTKGSKGLYEWLGWKNKDHIPRLAEGKYLKLLYTMHENAGTLDVSREKLRSELCPRCYLKPMCIKEGHEYELTVYCLEGIFSRRAS